MLKHCDIALKLLYSLDYIRIMKRSVRITQNFSINQLILIWMVNKLFIVHFKRNFAFKLLLWASLKGRKLAQNENMNALVFIVKTSCIWGQNTNISDKNSPSNLMLIKVMLLLAILWTLPNVSRTWQGVFWHLQSSGSFSSLTFIMQTKISPATVLYLDIISNFLNTPSLLTIFLQQSHYKVC